MPQVLRTWSLGDGPQVSACPEPSGSAASHPIWCQLLPLPLSDFVPACRGRSVPQGPCQPCPRCPTCAKSSEVERGHLFLDLTVFFQEFIFLLDFFESVFLLPLNFEALKNSLTTPPFFELWLWPPNHTPKFCAKLTSRLPNRPALTPPLITVLGSPHAPNCRCHPGRAKPCLLLY